MCFLLFFCIYPRGYRRKQAYSYILCNNRENKHIGNCDKFFPIRAIFIIKIKRYNRNYTLSITFFKTSMSVILLKAQRNFSEICRKSATFESRPSTSEAGTRCKVDSNKIWMSSELPVFNRKKSWFFEYPSLYSSSFVKILSDSVGLLCTSWQLRCN